jgi:hypothetical protein
VSALPAAPGGEERPAPYKGPNSYQVEDATLFFGREAEARQLVARILSRRLTLLHAPSGAGKTSLLNACIIPDLEKRGWMPVRVLPTDDPLASIRATTLQYVLPPLAAEREALRAAADALCGRGADPEVGELLQRYDKVDVNDPRKRSLIAPREIAAADASLLFPAGSSAVPYVCRLLRSSLSLRSLTEHFAALCAAGIPREPFVVAADTRVSALEAMLADPAVEASYDAVLGMLDLPATRLAEFFENLADVYVPRPGFCLVLILDQFEEMFTRFGDREGMQSFQRREQTFRELEELYTQCMDEEVAPDAAPLLPLRFVVSMRDEYLARILDHIRAFAGVSGEPGFHLYLLKEEQAGEAISKPAQAYGYDYDGKTYEGIVKGLLREGRYVEPTALQIVCERLWKVKGEALATGSQDAESRTIPSATLEDLEGVKGILASFFTDFVRDQLQDDRERFEAFEMLELLVTVNRTRNIMERNQLVRQLFRDLRLRHRVLDKLEKGKIVRVEQRLDGFFVEITHEFLIDPILDRLKHELMTETRFRDALRTLLHFADVNFRVGDGVLSEDHFRTLDHYFTVSEREGEVELTDWATELMFRSAVLRGVDAEAVRRWSDRFKALEPATVATVLGDADAGARKQTLSLEELWLLWESRDSHPLPAAHAELVLKSALNELGDHEREQVRYWTHAYRRTLKSA